MTLNIVVGVDGSAPARTAVEWAAADARRRGLGLRIVHVCEQRPYGAVEYCAGALAAAADRARGLAPDVPVITELLPGNSVDALIAESRPADSVVLGSRGLGGFAGMVVGSVGHAAGPVVIVRDPPGTPQGGVVVGHDGSEHAEAAMEYAVEQAGARRVPLRVVFARRPWHASAFVDTAREAAQRVDPWRAKWPDVEIIDIVQDGHPVAVLAAAGASADLVVVGSRGLGGFAAAVLGSVSHGVT
ncbi:Universal stress protein family [[Actinomadura] parvosata subsp. kistnae]|uniref:UspA domain-containing protein n=1 Tax=[Actinomadura] parvosata subsp. kistnae TaxID=1909395 RepID=A0A1U9ZZ17_9ACTN|nr:universal stress protein [Nonomuraea sp. ATCC 55076]AQZ63198.1 hypothetical protein BKM31_18570 [Nonomuraea sp. ATCC 55076]SPL98862.1 Universal stress protein family [Actinomadura parvosata subsp. kistnae]